MVYFMLCVFYHNKKKNWEKKDKEIRPEISHY